jgi:YidC/Oxa1 family membrane protein insertase
MTDSPSSKVNPKSLFDELRTLGMLLFNTDQEMQNILFYTSQAQYISYYDGLLDQLVGPAQKKVIYLSSDRDDSIFNDNRQNVFPYYSEILLPFVFPAIDSSIVITTVPDLHQYKLKRSFSGTNYVYMFHSLVSTHMMYRSGAFDYYDTIFCVGPHHLEEIRRVESLNNLRPKTLHEVGYCRLEKIYRDHQEYIHNGYNSDRSSKLVLVAPGWQDANILNTCAEELIKSLLAEGFHVVLRPHPMTIAKSPDLIDKYREAFSDANGFRLDTEITSEKYIHDADVMICDWSGVALEYAFGTERPVLFIDLPRKVYNPEYEKLGMVPLEVRIRNRIGKSISPDHAQNVGKLVSEFLDHEQEYREQIVSVRQDNIYNFGNSSKVGMDIIQDILIRKIKGRTE